MTHGLAKCKDASVCRRSCFLLERAKADDEVCRGASFKPLSNPAVDPQEGCARESVATPLKIFYPTCRRLGCDPANQAGTSLLVILIAGDHCT
jgi:hypothetical protein